jgi:CBS domain-containing protein
LVQYYSFFGLDAAGRLRLTRGLPTVIVNCVADRANKPLKETGWQHYSPGDETMATAQDVMITDFETLSPDASIAEAARLFCVAAEREGRRIFGMVVCDDDGKLLGMLSMYDILLFVGPKHAQLWGMMDDIELSGLMDHVCDRIKSVRVDEIMTTDVVTITPDTHVMMILDIMIKRHIRRLPVLSAERIQGIVYLSDLFYYLVGKLAS